MATTDTSTEAGALAGTLYDELTAGSDFTIPPVDLTQPQFQIPDLVPTENPSITEEALTTRTVGGTGMFDALMDAMNKHLDEQFNKNRITGAQYAEAYISMTGNALNAAVQFLLSKDQARWQSVLMQRQAHMAEIGVISARVGLEETKARLGITKIQSETAEAEYALTKLRLATEDASWSLQKAQLDVTQYNLSDLMPAQKDQILAGIELQTVQTAKANYELTSFLPAQLIGMETDNKVKDAQVIGMTKDNEVKDVEIQRVTFEMVEMLPAQKLVLEKDIEVKDAQILGMGKDNELKDSQITKSSFEVEFMLPAQLIGMTADNEIKGAQKDQIEYQITQLMPAQRLDVLAGTEAKEAQTAQILWTTQHMLPAQQAGVEMDTAAKTAQRDQILYETTSILPAQKHKLDTEVGVLDYQLTALYPAQVAGHTADTAGKVFTNDFILPANLASIQEQTEGHRAKTLDTRTDGVVVSGAMGIQKRLYEQQITSYQRDAETKAAKMMLDAWITQKTMDEGLTAPTNLNNAQIDTAFSKLRTNLDL